MVLQHGYVRGIGVGYFATVSEIRVESFIHRQATDENIVSGLGPGLPFTLGYNREQYLSLLPTWFNLNPSMDK